MLNLFLILKKDNLPNYIAKKKSGMRELQQQNHFVGIINMQHKGDNILKPFRVFTDKELGVATPYSKKLRLNAIN